MILKFIKGYNNKIDKKKIIQHKHLIKEGGWVFIGQVSTALIGLIGLRIFTEIAPADILGSATLLLGALSLLKNLMIAPIGNTQLRFHSEYLNKGYAKWFDINIKILYRKSISLSIAIIVITFIALIYFSSYKFNFLLLFILILYYIVGALKGNKINRLSAERRQKYIAIWQIVEAFLINTFFIIALLLVTNVESYLTGQSLALLVSLIIFGFITFPKIKKDHKEDLDISIVKNKVIRYGLPFVPLAIFSWISNLGDRYIIQNFLSLREVGIYTAVYSIASRPFLMINGVLTGFFRPVLFQKESIKELLTAKKTFEIWLFTASLIFIVTITIYALLGKIIINLLLSEAYSHNTYYIFLIIGIGYSIFSLNQILESRILSYGVSKKILLPNIISAIINILVNIVCLPIYGLEGAAFATALAFLLQLFITVYILNFSAQRN